MKLEVTKTVVFKTDGYSVEEYIEECVERGTLKGVKINGSYELNCKEEQSNYSMIDINATKEWIDKNPVSDCEKEELANGELSFQLANIMRLMAEQGLVEYGNYIIDTSW